METLPSIPPIRLATPIFRTRGRAEEAAFLAIADAKTAPRRQTNYCIKSDTHKSQREIARFSLLLSKPRQELVAFAEPFAVLDRKSLCCRSACIPISRSKRLGIRSVAHSAIAEPGDADSEIFSAFA